uniref:Metallothionein n=1 Tax=Tamarix androssowii TaxID=189785 RepID=C8KGJ2_9CARY|nr:metallothionein [Tamarix androssowii]
MSGKCGNCSCADKSQCVQKRNQYGFDLIETQTYAESTVVMDDPPTAAENGGQCKCGDRCACVNCTCGSH